MEECRGCRHVAQLITAFREKDQIVAVMPFHRNVDFRVSIFMSGRGPSDVTPGYPQQYFAVGPLSLIQAYMRCMLRALRDTHSRRIVHRDVKPANFLFDPQTGQGVLVDFGLAQVRVSSNLRGVCLLDSRKLTTTSRPNAIIRQHRM